jgi:hypothetical protein
LQIFMLKISGIRFLNKHGTIFYKLFAKLVRDFLFHNDMINRLIIGSFLVLQALFAWSQNDSDTLNHDKAFNCEDIASVSTHFIMKYYNNHDFDSARIVLTDWENASGISEPVIRTKILFAIRENTFSELIYDSTIVDFVLNYINRMEASNPDAFYEDYKPYFGCVPIRGEYDYFTQCIADTLLQMVFDDPLELLFSEFYANVLADPIKEIQKDTNYKYTNLKSYYYNAVDKYRYKPDVHLNLYSGIWIPTGNAALLGNHPFIGVQGGIRSKKMTYNLSLAFKFINSANDYYILKDGIVDTTDYFFGGYVGLDIEREILKSKKHEFDLLAGIGYDGFDSIKTNTEDDNPDNDKGHPINSVNVNFGLGYRYFYAKKRYVGLKGNYNVVNYNNDGGTNLLGDCITISLSIGGFGNTGKDYYLDELRYSE